MARFKTALNYDVLDAIAECIKKMNPKNFCLLNNHKTTHCKKNQLNKKKPFKCERTHVSPFVNIWPAARVSFFLFFFAFLLEWLECRISRKSFLHACRFFFVVKFQTWKKSDILYPTLLSKSTHTNLKKKWHRQKDVKSKLIAKKLTVNSNLKIA